MKTVCRKTIHVNGKPRKIKQIELDIDEKLSLAKENNLRMILFKMK